MDTQNTQVETPSKSRFKEYAGKAMLILAGILVLLIIFGMPKAASKKADQPFDEKQQRNEAIYEKSLQLAEKAIAVAEAKEAIEEALKKYSSEKEAHAKLKQEIVELQNKFIIDKSPIEVSPLLMESAKPEAKKLEAEMKVGSTSESGK